jgi:hypothetical protein
MPPEIVALLNKPELLIGVLAVGSVFGMVAEQAMSKWARQKWRRNNPKPWPPKKQGGRVTPEPWKPSSDQTPAKKPDAADQLRTVMGATFTIQPLLNRGEARVFKELDRAVIARNPTWQVMAQVSLGEILRCEDAAAYGCINSKRVDLLLMDGDCRPRHAIEYQGAGHHQGTAAARDAVKKEALRRAGIGYHEVVAGQTTPVELRRLVEKLVDGPAASGA